MVDEWQKADLKSIFQFSMSDVWLSNLIDGDPLLHNCIRLLMPVHNHSPHILHPKPEDLSCQLDLSSHHQLRTTAKRATPLPNAQWYVLILGCSDRHMQINCVSSSLPASNSDPRPATCKIAVSLRRAYLHYRQYQNYRP